MHVCGHIRYQLYSAARYLINGTILTFPLHTYFTSIQVQNGLSISYSVLYFINVLFFLSLRLRKLPRYTKVGRNQETVRDKFTETSIDFWILLSRI